MKQVNLIDTHLSLRHLTWRICPPTADQDSQRCAGNMRQHATCEPQEVSIYKGMDMPASNRRFDRKSIRALQTRIADLTYTILAISAILILAGMVLFAAYSAFTAKKFTLIDYGKYLNAVWNCGHGDLFRMLTEFSYLQTHLSFSLALLGPVFHLWDHPFTLAALQWLYTLTGMFIMQRTASRIGVPLHISVTLLIAFIASPFTQSVLLSEFHGVSLYFVILPWLYHCLLFSRRWAWVPLLLLWGVREEAAFIALPLILYIAAVQRWRMGYFMAALSAGYGLLACTVLFKWFSGVALTDRRPGVNRLDILARLQAAPARARLEPLGWLVLPALPFLRSGILPILVFPSVALLTALLSPYPHQFTLSSHYSAAAQVCLFLGILQSLTSKGGTAPHPFRTMSWGRASAVLCIALISYLQLGFLPGGGRHSRIYWGLNPDGVAACRAASNLPKEGLLLTDTVLAGFSANRRDLISWEQFHGNDSFRPDVIFTSAKLLYALREDPIWESVKREEFGVTYFDGVYATLVRGHAFEHNRRLIKAIEELPFTIRFAYTQRKAGKEQIGSDGSLIRYWGGNGATYALVAYGPAIALSPGSYRADFELRAGPPASANPKLDGRLILMRKGETSPFCDVSIVPGTPEPNGFFTQPIAFHIDRHQKVEPIVWGGERPLWLSKVVFRRATPHPQ